MAIALLSFAPAAHASMTVSGGTGSPITLAWSANTQVISIVAQKINCFLSCFPASTGDYMFRVIAPGGGTIGTPIFLPANGGYVTANYTIPAGASATSYTVQVDYSDSGGFYSPESITTSLTIYQSNTTIGSISYLSSLTYSPGATVTVFASTNNSAPTYVNVGGPCTASGMTITITGAGTCFFAAVVNATSNYTGASSPTYAITINPVSQTVFATTASSSYGFALGLLIPMTVSASSGLTTFNYTLLTPGVCTVSGNSLLVITGGTCSVNVTQPGNTNTASASRTVSVTINRANQVALVASAAPAAIAFGGTSTLSTTGGSGTGAVTYTVTSGGTFCSISGNTLTGTGVGSCTILAVKAQDVSYNIASANMTVTVNQANQPALTATATPSTLTFGGGTSTLSVAGGGGTGAVSYAVASGPCSISGSTLSTTGGGTCSITATKAASTNYTAITSSAISVTVNKAAQAALTASASPAAIPYNGTSSVNASGGSGGGAVSYAGTAGGTVCTISGSTVTGVGVGSCTVTATKAADADYLVATAATSITVNPAAQAALTVSASSTTLTFGGGTSSLAAAGGSGGGTVSFGVASGPCSVSGTTLSTTGAGACLVTATKAADVNYSAITSSAISITVNQAAQAALTASASAATILYNGTSTVSASGGSGGGSVSYAVTAGGGFCSISGGTVTGIGVGSCTVTATKAADTDYLVATAATNITVNPAAQVALTASASPATLTFGGGTSTLSATGGSGVGVVSYAIGSGPCVVSGSTLSSTGAGTCSITATRASDGNYNAVTSAAIAVTVNPASQAALTASASPATIPFNGTSTVIASGGSGSGSVSYAVTSGGGFCSISGGIVTGTGVGSCTVTATKAADADYLSATAATSITVSPAAQAALTASATPAAIAFGGTSTVAATGGSGLGAITYAITSGGAYCSISGGAVTGIGVGSCTITATKAADANYTVATATASIAVNQAAQAALTASASPASIAFGGTSTVAAAGGSGTGGLTYAVTAGGTFCSLAGATVTGTGVGTCTITATKATDTNYTAATATVNIGVGKAAQTIAFANPGAKTFGTAPFAVSASATSGLAVAFSSSTTGVCTTAGTTVTLVGGGTCSISAAQAGDVNFNAATPVVQSFAVGVAGQVISFANPGARTLVQGGAVALTATGGASGNAIVFTSGTSAVCTISGSNAIMQGAGTCSITASQAGNASYAAAAPVAQSFAINRVTTTTTLVSSRSSIRLGEPVTFTATVMQQGGANGARSSSSAAAATAAAAASTPATGVVSFSSGSAVICSNVPLVSGQASCTTAFSSAGSQTVSATYAGNGTTAISVSSVVAQSVEDQRPKTVEAIARFMGQRNNQMLTNGPDGQRQIDRLMDAEQAAGGSAASAAPSAASLASRFASGNGSTAMARAGVGPDVTDVTRMRLGLHDRQRTGMPQDELPGVPSMFDIGRDRTAGGGSLPAGPLRGSADFDGAMRFGFATSLSDMRKAAADVDKAKMQGADPALALAYGAGRFANGAARFSPLDIWFDGRYASFRDNRLATGNDGHFGLVSIGVDYVLNPSLLVGVMIQFDSMRQRSDAQSSEVSGKGWMAGPYATLRLSKNVFWQARAAWGQSENTVSPQATYSDSFQTERWLVSSALSGRWSYGAWQFRPSASLAYMEDAAKGYADTFGTAIPSITTRLGQAKAGPEFSYRAEFADGTIIEPRAGIQAVWNFAGEAIATGMVIGNEAAGPTGVRGRAEIGVQAISARGLSLDLAGSYDGIGARNYDAFVGKATVRVPLR